MSIHSGAYPSTSRTAPLVIQQAQQKAAQSQPTKTEFWGKDGMSFGDLLDVVNPLQHIPVVSDVYRKVTGDEQSRGAQMLGGALYGGIVGVVASFAEVSTEDAQGNSMGKQAIAMVTGETISTAQAQPVDPILVQPLPAKTGLSPEKNFSDIPPQSPLPPAIPNQNPESLSIASASHAADKHLSRFEKLERQVAASPAPRDEPIPHPNVILENTDQLENLPFAALPENGTEKPLPEKPLEELLSNVPESLPEDTASSPAPQREALLRLQQATHAYQQLNAATVGQEAVAGLALPEDNDDDVF